MFVAEKTVAVDLKEKNRSCTRMVAIGMRRGKAFEKYFDRKI